MLADIQSDSEMYILVVYLCTGMHVIGINTASGGTCMRQAKSTCTTFLRLISVVDAHFSMIP